MRITKLYTIILKIKLKTYDFQRLLSLKKYVLLIQLQYINTSSRRHRRIKFCIMFRKVKIGICFVLLSYDIYLYEITHIPMS